MTVLAIDPGPEQSAWVLYGDGCIFGHGLELNTKVLERLGDEHNSDFIGATVVIEEIASYGMPVGRDVFQTVRWSGRFEQAWAHECAWMHCAHVLEWLPRRDVKLHLCGQARAKDSNIRHALIDRFGGKEKAIGRKATQGPLYGLRADEWQALALAVTFHDRRATEAPNALRGDREARAVNVGCVGSE